MHARTHAHTHTRLYVKYATRHGEIKKVPFLCYTAKFLHQEHWSHRLVFPKYSVWKRWMMKAQGEEYNLFKERTYIRFHYQMSLLTWYLAGRQAPRRHSWVWRRGVSRSGSPAAWWNYRSLPPTASEVLAPHLLLLSRRKKKWLTTVNWRWNLICFKVNSGQGSLPGEGVSSGAPINMPTIPRFQQAHLGKKQSGKGISQKTVMLELSSRGSIQDLTAESEIWGPTVRLLKPRGTSKIF